VISTALTFDESDDKEKSHCRKPKRGSAW